MASLIETVQSDMKSAMRSGDTLRRDVLRFLSSVLKNEALEKRKSLSDLSDDEAIAVVRRGVKQRKDSIEQYQSGGREDLAEKERQEKEILESYLPAAPDESVIRAAVENAIHETGAASPRDLGKVMGIAMKLAAGASGDEVRRIAVEQLTTLSDSGR